MTLCYVIEDLYGYFIHRYMHYNKKLYNWVHLQHHIYHGDCFLTAFYVHGVELIAFYFVGLVIGPLVISNFWYISFLGYNFWLIGATFFLVWSHTGLNIPYMPSTTIHFNHHKYYNVNYGTAFSDWIFGTLKV
jgi:sphinganine C4-monooxygenase